MRRLFLLLFLSFFTVNTQAQNFPERARLHFSGPFGVPATMEFSYEENHYSIFTTVKIPFKPITFQSNGVIQNNRLLPINFEDRRGGKLYAAANFDLAGKQIQYGRNGELKSAKMTHLTQDFFSLAWQITLNQGPLKESIQATNGKKVYLRDNFKEISSAQQEINGKETTIRHFVNGEGDDRIELGIAPEILSLPALIVYYDKGKRYELRLTKVEL